MKNNDTLNSNTRSVFVQTTLRVSETDDETLVVSDRGCQTTTSTIPYTDNQAVIPFLEFTPFSEIIKDSQKVVDLPRKALLQFDLERRNPKKSISEISPKSALKKSQSSMENLDNENITPAQPTKSPKSMEEQETQTNLTVSPYILDEDSVANVYTQLSVQTSITFDPTDSLSEIAPALKKSRKHTKNFQSVVVDGKIITDYVDPNGDNESKKSQEGVTGEENKPIVSKVNSENVPVKEKTSKIVDKKMSTNKSSNIMDSKKKEDEPLSRSVLMEHPVPLYMTEEEFEQNVQKILDKTVRNVYEFMGKIVEMYEQSKPKEENETSANITTEEQDQKKLFSTINEEGEGEEQDEIEVVTTKEESNLLDKPPPLSKSGIAEDKELPTPDDVAFSTPTKIKPTEMVTGLVRGPKWFIQQTFGVDIDTGTVVPGKLKSPADDQEITIGSEINFEGSENEILFVPVNNEEAEAHFSPKNKTPTNGKEEEEITTKKSSIKEMLTEVEENNENEGEEKVRVDEEITDKEETLETSENKENVDQSNDNIPNDDVKSENEEQKKHDENIEDTNDNEDVSGVENLKETEEVKSSVIIDLPATEILTGASEKSSNIDNKQSSSMPPPSASHSHSIDNDTSEAPKEDIGDSSKKSVSDIIPCECSKLHEGGAAPPALSPPALSPPRAQPETSIKFELTVFNDGNVNQRVEGLIIKASVSRLEEKDEDSDTRRDVINVSLIVGGQQTVVRPGEQLAIEGIPNKDSKNQNEELFITCLCDSNTQSTANNEIAETINNIPCVSKEAVEVECSCPSDGEGRDNARDDEENCSCSSEEEALKEKVDSVKLSVPKLDSKEITQSQTTTKSKESTPISKSSSRKSDQRTQSGINICECPKQVGTEKQSEIIKVEEEFTNNSRSETFTEVEQSIEFLECGCRKPKETEQSEVDICVCCKKVVSAKQSELKQDSEIKSQTTSKSKQSVVPSESGSKKSEQKTQSEITICECPKEDPEIKSKSQITAKSKESTALSEHGSKKSEQKSRSEINICACPKESSEIKSKSQTSSKSKESTVPSEIASKKSEQKTQSEITICGCPKEDPEIKSTSQITAKSKESTALSEHGSKKSEQKSRSEINICACPKESSEIKSKSQTSSKSKESTVPSEIGSKKSEQKTQSEITICGCPKEDPEIKSTSQITAKSKESTVPSEIGSKKSEQKTQSEITICGCPKEDPEIKSTSQITAKSKESAALSVSGSKKSEQKSPSAINICACSKEASKTKSKSQTTVKSKESTALSERGSIKSEQKSRSEITICACGKQTGSVQQSEAKLEEQTFIEAKESVELLECGCKKPRDKVNICVSNKEAESVKQSEYELKRESKTKSNSQTPIKPGVSQEFLECGCRKPKKEISNKQESKPKLPIVESRPKVSFPYLPQSGESLTCSSKSLSQSRGSVACSSKSLPQSGGSLACSSKSLPQSGGSLACSSKSLPQSGESLPCSSKSLPLSVKQMSDTEIICSCIHKEKPQSVSTLPQKQSILKTSSVSKEKVICSCKAGTLKTQQTRDDSCTCKRSDLKSSFSQKKSELISPCKTEENKIEKFTLPPQNVCPCGDKIKNPSFDRNVKDDCLCSSEQTNKYRQSIESYMKKLINDSINTKDPELIQKHAACLQPYLNQLADNLEDLEGIGGREIRCTGDASQQCVCSVEVLFVNDDNLYPDRVDKSCDCSIPRIKKPPQIKESTQPLVTKSCNCDMENEPTPNLECMYEEENEYNETYMEELEESGNYIYLEQSESEKAECLCKQYELPEVVVDSDKCPSGIEMPWLSIALPPPGTYEIKSTKSTKKFCECWKLDLKDSILSANEGTDAKKPSCGCLSSKTGEYETTFEEEISINSLAEKETPNQEIGPKDISSSDDDSSGCTCVDSEDECEDIRHTGFVYDNPCFAQNEPYLDPLYKIFPDDCDTYCGPFTEIHWSDILLPKRVKLRQAKKSKSVSVYPKVEETEDKKNVLLDSNNNPESNITSEFEMEVSFAQIASSLIKVEGGADSQLTVSEISTISDLRMKLKRCPKDYMVTAVTDNNQKEVQGRVESGGSQPFSVSAFKTLHDNVTGFVVAVGTTSNLPPDVKESALMDTVNLDPPNLKVNEKTSLSLPNLSNATLTETEFREKYPQAFSLPPTESFSKNEKLNVTIKDEQDELSNKLCYPCKKEVRDPSTLKNLNNRSVINNTISTNTVKSEEFRKKYNIPPPTYEDPKSMGLYTYTMPETEKRSSDILMMMGKNRELTVRESTSQRMKTAEKPKTEERRSNVRIMTGKSEVEQKLSQSGGCKPICSKPCSRTSTKTPLNIQEITQIEMKPINDKIESIKAKLRDMDIPELNNWRNVIHTAERPSYSQSPYPTTTQTFQPYYQFPQAPYASSMFPPGYFPPQFSYAGSIDYSMYGHQPYSSYYPTMDFDGTEENYTCTCSKRRTVRKRKKNARVSSSEYSAMSTESSGSKNSTSAKNVSYKCRSNKTPRAISSESESRYSSQVSFSCDDNRYEQSNVNSTDNYEGYTQTDTEPEVEIRVGKGPPMIKTKGSFKGFVTKDPDKCKFRVAVKLSASKMRSLQKKNRSEDESSSCG